LVEGGHEVHGLARRPPDAARVADLPLTLHAGDMCDAAWLAALVADVAPAGVVHLAAVAEPAAAERDLEAAYRTNLGGTLARVAAARAATPSARLVGVSSSGVYGAVEPERLPATEDVPLRPLSVYGASKAAAEIAALQWGRAHNLDVVVARPFNHTGPGQSPAYVCAALASQVAAIEAGRAAPRA